MDDSGVPMNVLDRRIAVIDDDLRVLESLVNLLGHLDTEQKATNPQNNFWNPVPFPEPVASSRMSRCGK